MFFVMKFKFMKRISTIFFFCFLAVPILFSQNNEEDELLESDSMMITNQTIEPVWDYFQAYYYDTLKYSPLLMPLVFDGKWVPDTLSLSLVEKDEKKIISPFDFLYQLPSLKSKELDYFIKQSTKNYVYTKSPDIVKYNMNMLPKILPEKNMITNPLKNLFRSEPDAQLELSIPWAYPKEVFWWKVVNTTLNISQIYLSDNWYKGGESNINLLNIQNVKFGYNNKSTLEFETELECKFNFYNTPSDTIRSFRVNDDVSFIKSKLGYKAYKKFYYTFSTEFKTQVFNNYNPNTAAKVTSFLSPANLYFSLGMDYKLSTPKITMSVILSPFSYRLIHVDDLEIDETAFGLDEGTHSLKTLGSMLTADVNWSFNKQIKWTSRLHYYTTYEKVETEWENTMSFIFNRYLSTKIILHARFDDSVAKSENIGYFQLREMITFGISYKW